MNKQAILSEMNFLTDLHAEYINSLAVGNMVGAINAHNDLCLKSLEYLSDLSDDMEDKVLIMEHVTKMRYELGKQSAMMEAAIRYDEKFASESSRKKPLS